MIVETIQATQPAQKYVVGTKNINLKDFQMLNEDVLIERFTIQLEEIHKKGEISAYTETLRTDKKDLTVKRNGYMSMLTGKPVKKEYWDSTLKAYYDKIGFKYEILEKLENIPVRNKDTKQTELKPTLMIYVLNNIKDADKTDVVNTIETIIATFDIDNEFKTELINVLGKYQNKEIKQEDIVNLNIIKKNIDIYNDAHDGVKEFYNNQILSFEIYKDKLNASLKFIGWKLDRIKVFLKEYEKAESDLKLDTLKPKIEKRLKEDKKFKNLHDIVLKTWSF